MAEQQREDQVAPCNCDNDCALCALSARAHSLRDSGIRLRSRSVEGVRHMYRRVTGGLPGFAGRCGRNVRGWGTVVLISPVTVYFWETLRLRNVYRQISMRVASFKEFIERNTTVAFFFGGTLLILGTFLFVTSLFDESRYDIFNFSLFMILLAGMFIWIPVYFWMCDTTHQTPFSASSQDSEQGPDAVLVDEPPRYSSLITDPDMYKVAPPPYDEVCHVGDHHPQQQLSDAVTLCSVHQALTDTRHQAASASPGSGLGRSRSLGDLHSREALLS